MRMVVRGGVILVWGIGLLPVCVAQQGSDPATFGDLLKRQATPPASRASGGPEASRQPRHAVPERSEVQQARELIRQVYEQEYKAAARNPALLVRKLVEVAGDTKDIVRKYALLLEAEESAARAGAHALTLEVIDLRAGEFAVDGMESKANRLADFVTSKVKGEPVTMLALYRLAVQTAESGVEQDSLQHAQSAAETALNVARALLILGKKTNNAVVIEQGEAHRSQAVSLVKAIERRIELADKYQRALQTLKTMPDDQDANSAAGQYLCFVVGYWKKGLPYLAKGGQKDMATTAAMEIDAFASEKPPAKQVFAVAGNLWGVAESKDTTQANAEAIKNHAADLYRMIVGDLEEPLDKAVAKKRIAAYPGKPAGVLGSGGREITALVALTSDWGSVTFHPAEAVVIERQEVVRGGRQWVVEGNKISLAGVAFRRSESVVRVVCRVNLSAKQLTLETHKGDIGSLSIEVGSDGKVLDRFTNDGARGGNAERSEQCRRDFPVAFAGSGLGGSPKPRADEPLGFRASDR